MNPKYRQMTIYLIQSFLFEYNMVIELPDPVMYYKEAVMQKGPFNDKQLSMQL